MSKRYDLVPLGDMYDYARRVAAKVEGVTREAFDADDDRQLAITYLLQTIGEAARRVSAEGRAMHPAIEWHKIVGMRNRVVHEYRDVDFATVWEVATTEIPRLIDALRQFMPNEPPE
ncbi:MAG TPA: HepT-like ribonuclease domain-containing protein [Thermoanaerobaculia bacterium]|nr:HepT-like ribonuclease domain-containing protein [Thermoanaerobaculia bacterium]